jgi:hypothetical protein
MSLKHFHVVFIVFAVLISFGFGAWALLANDQTTSIRSLGMFSLVIGAALSAYGVWFFQKAKRVIT